MKSIFPEFSGEMPFSLLTFLEPEEHCSQFWFTSSRMEEALPKLSPEERWEIRAKLNELDDEEWFDNGELSEQEKAIIEARLDEYDRNPGVGSSWEEAKDRILGGLHGK